MHRLLGAAEPLLMVPGRVFVAGDLLDAYVFDSLEQVREVSESWLREYNEERPHESLGRVPQLMILPRSKLPAESNSEPWA